MNPKIFNKEKNGYPPNLMELDYPPETIWTLGDLSLLDKPLLAIVGSRNANAQSIKTTTAIVEAAIQQGYGVISGLAAGVDTAAHQAALRLKAPNVAVLGTPLHEYYPAKNRLIQDRIAETGLLISETGRTTRLSFAIRNRTIAALSRGVIVVACEEGSGTRYAVEYAIEICRPVWFVLGDCRGEWVQQVLDNQASSGLVKFAQEIPWLKGVLG